LNNSKLCACARVRQNRAPLSYVNTQMSFSTSANANSSNSATSSTSSGALTVQNALHEPVRHYAQQPSANVYIVKQDEIEFVDKPSQNLLCPVCTERERQRELPASARSISKMRVRSFDRRSHDAQVPARLLSFVLREVACTDVKDCQLSAVSRVRRVAHALANSGVHTNHQRLESEMRVLQAGLSCRRDVGREVLSRERLRLSHQCLSTQASGGTACFGAKLTRA
jgi:hypothetical protein